MVKKLVRHGNSLALVIDRAVLELLNIDAETLLKLSTPDGKLLQISVASESDRAQAAKEAIGNTKKKLSKTLKNLAK